MKAFMSLLALVLLLGIPLAANANPVYVGYGTLQVTYSPPTGGGYYLDYDGIAAATFLNQNIIFPTNSVDIFCVSGEHLRPSETDFDFFKFEAPVDAKYAEATWIADNWINYIPLNGDSDLYKGEAQKAIWRVLGIMNITDATGVDYDLYSQALNNPSYVTQNWLWAVSPSGQNPNSYNNQDYLVPFTSGGDVPVPEPSTLLLLGLGLTGVVAYKKVRS
jgi:hypothetical protein